MGINNNVNVGSGAKVGGAGPVGGAKGPETTKGIAAIAGIEGKANEGSSSSAKLLGAMFEAAVALGQKS